MEEMGILSSVGKSLQNSVDFVTQNVEISIFKEKNGLKFFFILN